MTRFIPLLLVVLIMAGCAVAPQDGSQGPTVGMFGAMRKQALAQEQAQVQAQAQAAAMVPAPNPRNDIRIMNSFQVGVSTVTDAVRVLGAPTLVNHAPDGRFVYMYDFASTPQGPTVAGMLFGANQVLVKVDYFAKGPSKGK